MYSKIRIPLYLLVSFSVCRHDYTIPEFWAGVVGTIGLVLVFQLEIWNRVKNERQTVEPMCCEDEGEKPVREREVQGEIDGGTWGD